MEICGECQDSGMFGGRVWGGVFGGAAHEEEPFGQEAVGGREVGCEGAHCDWRYVLVVYTSAVVFFNGFWLEVSSMAGWLDQQSADPCACPNKPPASAW